MRRLLIAGAALLLATGPIRADEAPAAPDAAAATTTDAAAAKAAQRGADTAAALVLLEETSDYLGGRASFEAVVDQSYDAPQANGVMLEFGATRTITVRRPDRLRTHVEDRDGSERTLTWDGTRVLVAFPDESAYMTEAFEGDLDGLIDFMQGRLATPIPLSGLLRSDFYAAVADQVDYAFTVGFAEIAGVPCVQAAYQTAEVDFQIWVEEGPRPLPRQVVITYKAEEGHPTFRARFLSWDTNPVAGDERFSTTPPPGSNRLTIRVPKMADDQGGED